MLWHSKQHNKIVYNNALHFVYGFANKAIESMFYFSIYLIVFCRLIVILQVFEWKNMDVEHKDN